MKYAKPNVPAALHNRVKRLAKKRKTKLGLQYEIVLEAGLKVEEKKK